jgi:amidase
VREEAKTVITGDALHQAGAIRRGDITAAELLAETLERIDRFDQRLRSYVTIDAAGAVTAAKQADDELRRVGPDRVPRFHGVPLSIKDVIDVAGMPTTHSCKALVDNVADLDAPLVRRFRAAGFIILGKTNVPEFCTSMTTSELNGVCRNPWDLDRTAGGSSGGAAAAVAARLCAVAHGTDGAGSVRVPASFCGLVGLKPTRRLIAFGPDEDDLYFGTSEPGVLARSVRDAAAVLDVMVGDRSAQSSWSPRPPHSYTEQLGRGLPRLKVAVCTTPPFGAVTHDCKQAAIDGGRLLESLGHMVETAAPDWGAILVAAAGPMSVPGAAGLVNPEQYHLVEPRNRPLVSRLAAMTVLDHYRWAEQARAAAAAFVRFWDGFDVLVSPTCGMVAPRVDWAPWDQTPEEHMNVFATFPSFAQPFNLSGQPALSLPLGWSPEGLPIGVQIAGRMLGEGRLLALAAELEGAAPWADRVAPDPI